MTVCILVRHGRSTANSTGVLAGWTPRVHLDETGHDQAAALARRLADLPVSRVVSSPLMRCRETAEYLSRSAELLVEDDLGECRYGSWTGRPLKELADEPLWRSVQDHPSAAAFPASESYAGESLAQMSHRAVAAVRRHDEEVARQHGDDAVWVVVSHGDVIKAVLADAVGSHLDHFQRFCADPASVSAVAYTSRRPFLLTANNLGGDLAWLRPRRTDEAGAEPETASPSPAEREGGDAIVGGGAG